ncbi:MAG: response regulator transcription factor [Balneolaceae bacterium]|nr:response regulator transcription factor [Balneolaceae bacterium]MBO6546076.1 response regulator transcription factor [Balneolaceae bacterium]MBO6647472.1 response regulator transcription factor [Balneolaceae bacterium]
MISYLIIDDEPIAHGIIEKYCENFTHLQKAGNCFNAKEALEKLYQEQIDLIFLDINMPEISGFEFLRSLRNPPRVIVTSAYQEYALEGFELDITDYLLKPFSLQRFMKAVNKVIDSLNEQIDVLAKGPSSELLNDALIFIKEKGGSKVYQVKEGDILFVEASGNYSKVVLNDKEIITHQKISELEQQLSKEAFIRTHKSFIISRNRIKSIEGNQIEIENHTIPIGQTYKEQVKKLLKI